MPLTYTKLMSAVYNYFKGPPLFFYWDDGCTVKAIDETGVYESDNGIFEEDDPNHLEYYAFAVRILEVIVLPDSPTADLIKEILRNGYLLEISAELNGPSKIETLDGKVIWKRGDE